MGEFTRTERELFAERMKLRRLRQKRTETVFLMSILCVLAFVGGYVTASIWPHQNVFLKHQGNCVGAASSGPRPVAKL